MKQRNPSIDILKFFAALLITNSHMGMLYPESLVRLSTGAQSVMCCFFSAVALPCSWEGEETSLIGISGVSTGSILPC